MCQAAQVTAPLLNNWPSVLQKFLQGSNPFISLVKKWWGRGVERDLVLIANLLNKIKFGGKYLVFKKPICFFPFSLNPLKFGFLPSLSNSRASLTSMLQIQ